MRVLILPSWYLPAGGYFIKEQALFLQERGLDVAVLANVAVSITHGKSRYLTLPWHCFSTMEDGLLTYRCYTRNLPKNEQLNLKRWCNFTVHLFERYLKEVGRPDIIHVHSSTWGGYAASLIKEKFGVPYIITEHRGIMALQSKYAVSQFQDWQEYYFKKAFNNADYIVPVSDQLMRKISEYTDQHVPWCSIPNIVDTDFFSCRKHHRNSPFHFVCVNGYYQVKAYDVLLQAFDLFCETNKNARITIAGENFNHPDFQVLLQQCLNRDKITFSGELNREQVRNLLWEADAFLLSSRVEAQPIAVLEALSAGVPVVVTDVVPEYVIPSFCGYRVENENVEAFAAAMQQMVETRDCFDEDQISSHATKIASKDLIIDQITEVYGKVLYEK